MIAGMRLQQKGDRVRSPLAQAAPGLIGRIAELSGCFQNALARLCMHAGAAVECPRNRPDRDIQVTGKIANVQSV